MKIDPKILHNTHRLENGYIWQTRLMRSRNTISSIKFAFTIRQLWADTMMVSAAMLFISLPA